MELIRRAMRNADERGFVCDVTRWNELQEGIAALRALYPKCEVTYEVVARGFNTGTVQVKKFGREFVIDDISALQKAISKADDITFAPMRGYMIMYVRYFNVLITK